MATIRIQHAIQDIDGLSKDRYVNTFYANWIGVPSGAQMLEVAGAVKGFYADAHPTTRVRDYMASHARGPGATVKMYEMTLAPTHPPIYEEEYEFPDLSGSATSYPSEVAVCLSFKADAVPGVDPKSLRGRIYIGPLNESSGSEGNANVPVRPTAVFTAALLAAADALKVGITAAGGAWCIYSPTLHKNLATEYAYGITSASVDDAFDTQRRRGCAPTGKTSTVFA